MELKGHLKWIRMSSRSLLRAGGLQHVNIKRHQGNVLITTSRGPEAGTTSVKDESISHVWQECKAAPNPNETAYRTAL
jgi:hypothetical protein